MTDRSREAQQCCARGGGVVESPEGVPHLDRISSHLEIFFLADAILDLFGDPVPPEHVGRGRPPHVVTDKNRQKVMLLLALERAEDDVAAAIGITAPTLRKHYFRELKARHDARLRLDGALLGALASEAAAGNVAAVKELYKRVEKHDQVKLSQSVAARGSQAKPVPLGKKEAARQAAEAMQGQFQRREPPPGMTH